MENRVLGRDREVAPAVARSVGRALEPRYEAYREEVERLIRAGMAEIVEKGSVEPRVSDIVRRAGLSNKAFYRHFRSKDELLLAILEEAMRERVQVFDERLGRQETGRAKVRAWVDTVVEQAMNPTFAEMTRPLLVYQARLADTLGEQLWGHRDHLRAPLERALDEARRSGELPAGDSLADSQVVYFAVMGWMHGMVLEQRQPQRAEAEHLAAFVLRGLGFGD